MWPYILRRLLYNIPVYFGILLLVMAALRVRDPIEQHLGKFPDEEQRQALIENAGLDRPFPEQYLDYVVGFDLDRESWGKPGKTVAELLGEAIGPTIAITLPALVLTSLLSIVIGLVSAFHRGRWLDKALVVAAVLGMSVSFLVYIILLQYFGSFKLNEGLGLDIFAIQGYETDRFGWWFYYCLLPVLISTIVAMGYDTRYYRTVMVEETNRDYIRTARAKGVGERRVMFVHMLKNAMVSIVTRIMITLPFLITGSILLEIYFNIPGMGKMLITAVNGADYPVVQGFTAVFAAFFIVTIILTDVLYALVDPRVRLR